ncbi:lasso peptide biosynthesis B2 protein [Phenylobacterium sp.]|uniref:lasso peptide biosynthesis B2 protein n=1 Tax=Phenylobacterium sp. TaxID=1871053 RepID=UPI003568CB6D
MIADIKLRQDVRIAAVERDLVILDISGDTYSCLPEAAQAWSDFEAGSGSAQAEAIAAALLDGGLAERGARRTPVPRPPSLPSECCLDGQQDRLRWSDIVALTGSYLDYRFRYEGRTFAQILKFVRRPGRASVSGKSDAELYRLSRTFQRLVIWLPAPGKCLVRSFLLLRFLQRSGADAIWVFGVETWPFEAHCWLQKGEVVLDDRPERVAAYEPIHAV